jgi:hypothetical protein
MKKLFMLVLFVVLLSGCAYSQEGSRALIYERYPNSTITTVPGSSYKFLVQLSTGEVRLVKCLGIDNQITEDIIFFKAVK